LSFFSFLLIIIELN